MTLLLAMNIHTIAGHMKDKSTDTAAQPLVSVAQAAAAENMPSVNDSSSKTKSDKDALEGWVSVLDANEAAEMSPDVGDTAGKSKKRFLLRRMTVPRVFPAHRSKPARLALAPTRTPKSARPRPIWSRIFWPVSPPSRVSSSSLTSRSMC
ncbi:hypothetical protein AA0474_0281 [Acetobacter lovaniensis NRIC 0474]|nr:hypothetical protein AA0474_0281 [Acetobacter lovaniensis NRIC 0474]